MVKMNEIDKTIIGNITATLSFMRPFARRLLQLFIDKYCRNCEGFFPEKRLNGGCKNCEVYILMNKLVDVNH